MKSHTNGSPVSQGIETGLSAMRQLPGGTVCYNRGTATVDLFLARPKWAIRPMAFPRYSATDNRMFHTIIAARRRNVQRMRICTLALCTAIALLGSIPSEADDTQVKPQSLFNGRDLSSWHVDVPHLDENPDAKVPFVVRDGMLVGLGEPAGHLITDAKFKNYRLEVVYRFAEKPGNCGILVHASKPRALYRMLPKSIEVQMHHDNAGDFWCIVEDIAVPDMVKRRGAKEKWGINEGKARRILNLTDGSEKPPGKWNTMVIECVGNSIKVWVNGDLVNHGFECTANQGQIAVQAEGSEVEFQKLMLTPITKLSETGK